MVLSSDTVATLLEVYVCGLGISVFFRTCVASGFWVDALLLCAVYTLSSIEDAALGCFYGSGLETGFSRGQKRAEKGKTGQFWAELARRACL